MYTFGRFRLISVSGFLMAMMKVIIGSDITSTLFLLKTFDPKNHPESPKMKRVIELKQNYLQDYHHSWNYPIVENLNKHLFQLCTYHQCFIVIENYQRINVRKLHYPIVLRNPVPLVHQISRPPRSHKLQRKISYSIVAGIETSHFVNISVPLKLSSRYCPLSKYLIRYDKYDVACLEIESSQFVRHSRVFSYRLHIRLYPMRALGLSNPSIFWVGLEKPAYYAFSSSVSTFNILILSGECQKFEFDQLSSLMKWIPSAMTESLHAHYNDVFVILRVKHTAISNLQKFVDTCGIIASGEVLRICPSCALYNDTSLDSGTILKSKVHSLEQSVLLLLAFPEFNEKLVWQMVDHIVTYNLLALALRALTRYCQKRSYRKFWLDISRETSSLDKVAQAHAEVWKSLLGNFSISGVKPFESCHGRQSNFPLEIVQHEYDSPTYHFQYYPQDYMSRLQFIGCGRQGISSLPFLELTKVFDNVIWICVLITINLAPICVLQLNGRKQICSGILSMVKMFLEQGSPFLETVTNKIRVRCLVALFLLAGILISNAYKNTNIYRMVVPRSPIPYRYFHEILRDDFHVYTRSVSSIFSKQVKPNGSYEKLQGILIHDHAVYIILETRQLLYEYNLDGLGSTQKRENRVGETLIRRAAKLHPMFEPTFSKLLQEKVSGSNTTRQKDIAMIFGIYEEFKQKEMILLQNSVEECKKSVIVLPQYICMKFYDVFVKEKSMQYIFIGEETYSESNWLFTVDGLAPPHLVKRIRGFSEFGVWKWWMDLFGRQTIKETKDTVEAAKMSGNIAIVFVVWFCGISAATVCIVVENCKRFFKNY